MGYLVVASQIKSFINKEVQLILKLIIVLSVIYLVLVNISLLTLFIFGVVLVSLAIFLKLKIKKLKKEGFKVGPKMNALLFKKSIFDIYSDIIYFPVITKVIGAFLRPAISKPHPQELKKSFEDIPQKAKQIISTKGLIHLFPKCIQQLAYKQGEIMEPVRKEWTWVNAQTYKMHQQVHEQTVSKQLMDNIDKNLSWTSILFMALIIGYGLKSMRISRAKRMFIQNGCFTGAILLIVASLVKIKKMQKQKQKKNLLLALQERVVQSQ